MNWNNVLFGQLPYVLITIGILGTIYRFTSNRFSWSSQSSEFLENKTLFYGSVPWHYGIILILLAHIVVAFIPRVLLAWNSSPGRLYAFELVGLILGFSALFGLLALIYRRLSNNRVRAVTSSWDVLVLIILIIQVVTGLGNAILYKWGSNWYAATAVPWIWSVITLRADASYIANLPLVTKIHVFNAMIFIAFIPFTRFVHFLAFWGPLKYLGRSYQMVRWYSRAEKTENLRQFK
jgi:nitrate reductase gamma subunit